MTKTKYRIIECTNLKTGTKYYVLQEKQWFFFVPEWRFVHSDHSISKLEGYLKRYTEEKSGPLVVGEYDKNGDKI